MCTGWSFSVLTGCSVCDLTGCILCVLNGCFFCVLTSFRDINNEGIVCKLGNIKKIYLKLRFKQIIVKEQDFY